MMKTKPVIKYKKVDKNAIMPKAAGENEVGHDLYVIKLSKKIGGKTYMYDTGIAIEPPNGFFTYIYPRSSIIKSGYMMSNSCGIIDPTYRGTLRICLTKIDESLPDLKLPCRIGQLVVAKFYKMECVEGVLSDTTRGVGGFGSTNK